MANGDNRGNRSITGGVIIVVVGIVCLLANLHPDLDVWSIAMRFWPVILIIIGLGKITDAFLLRADANATRSRNDAGVTISILILAGLFLFVVFRSQHRGVVLQDSQIVELQGAKSVEASFELPSGSIDLSGGSTHLLDANFRYRARDGRPNAAYVVNNGQGALDLTQDTPSHTHIAGSGNEWKLRMADGVPLDLKVEIGAGQGDLRLKGLDVDHLVAKVGAGKLNIDLTGPRKSDLHVEVEGGVGSGTVRLPKDVGFRVHASGGIGAVSANGLRKEGDDYVNDALGKSPNTIYVTINGGVGHITLEQE